MMGPGLDFSKFEFASPHQPDGRWVEWFCDEVNRRFIKIRMQLDPDAPIRFTSTMRAMPGFAVYYGESTPSVSENLVQSAVDDDIGMMFSLSGDMSMHFKRSDVALSSATGAIVSNDAYARFAVRSSASMFAMKVSRRLLEPFVPNIADTVGQPLRADTQAARLLLGYIRMLDREERIGTPEDARLVTTHVRDLAALLLGASRDGAAEAGNGGLRAARLAAVKADIMANATHRDLTIDALAGRHGISPRYIRSLFEGIGTTFTDFVLEQRLANAHRLLTDPRADRRTISAIAFDSGFGDLSYFNQAFRRRYGGTPSEIRARAGVQD